MSNVPTEDELSAHAMDRNAITVTESKLKDNIAKADFYVHPGSQLTVCILTLVNGFTVTGQSACADPKMFDQEIGEKYAFADAEKKIWPLLGYALKQELYLSGEVSTFQGRVRLEAKELELKVTSLGSFIGGSEHFAKLDEEDRYLLDIQYLTMKAYLDILKRRIARF